MERETAAALPSDTWEFKDSSFTEDDAAKIRELSVHPGEVEIIIPGKGERPWNAPDGFMCLYESFFSEAHLIFPIPNVLVELCRRKGLMFCQLSPAAIANMVALMRIARLCHGYLTSWKFEAACGLVHIVDRVTRRPTATYYAPCGASEGLTSKFASWRSKYFFVRKNEHTIFNKDADFIRQWNSVPVPSGKLKCPSFDPELGAWRELMPVPHSDLAPDVLRGIWADYGDTFWDEKLPMPPASSASKGKSKRAPKPRLSKRSKVGSTPMPQQVGTSSGQTEMAGKRKRDSAVVISDQVPVDTSGEFPPFHFSFEGGKRVQEDDAKCEELLIKLGGIEQTYPPTENRCLSDAAFRLGRHFVRGAWLSAGIINGFERCIRERDEEVRDLKAKLLATEEEVGILKADVADLEAVREEGRTKLQRARACVEGFKAAFGATVKYRETESVAISLRHLLEGDCTLDKKLVEWYEAESKSLKSSAEEVEVEELDPAFFSL